MLNLTKNVIAITLLIIFLCISGCQKSNIEPKAIEQSQDIFFIESKAMGSLSGECLIAYEIVKQNHNLYYKSVSVDFIIDESVYVASFSCDHRFENNLIMTVMLLKDKNGKLIHKSIISHLDKNYNIIAWAAH